jgi:hypothetical protein
VLQKQKEKLKEQDKQDIEDVIATDDSDKEVRKPRPQRIKRKPARDCYYTAKEAEAGDPLLVDNPAKTTTDSEHDS